MGNLLLPILISNTSQGSTFRVTMQCWVTVTNLLGVRTPLDCGACSAGCCAAVIQSIRVCSGGSASSENRRCLQKSLGPQNHATDQYCLHHPLSRITPFLYLSRAQDTPAACAALLQGEQSSQKGTVLRHSTPPRQEQAQAAQICSQGVGRLQEMYTLHMGCGKC